MNFLKAVQLKLLVTFLLITFGLQAISSNAPMSADDYIQAGIKKYKKKKYSEAIDCFSKTIEMEPKKTDAYIYRAIAKDAMDNFNEAIADFNLANKLDTNDIFVYIERAKTYLNANKFEFAEKDFLKVTQLNPNGKDGEEAWDFLAKIKYQQKGYKYAVNYYTRVLKFRPNDSSVLLKRGECKFYLNDYTGAIKDFTLVIDVDDDQETALGLRGEAKMKLNDKDGACRDLVKARKHGFVSNDSKVRQSCR